MKPDINLRDYESEFARFDSLMPYRVRDILLISSLFDSFILEEDGQLAQLITGEYAELSLAYAPHIRRVSTGQEALELLRGEKFDLIIIVRRLSDWDLADFCARAREIIPNLPITLLAFQIQDLISLGEGNWRRAVDKTFLWNGDIKLILAIVKCVEDRFNVEHDTRLVGVRTIILIEDSVRYYSVFLPLIYAEILRQTVSLMAEGINEAHRLLRIRARPKILLAETYEEGQRLFDKYRDYLLGVISDVKYSREGSIDPRAGIKFARVAKLAIPDLPILLQSSNIKNALVAAEHGLAFLHKKSPSLLADLRYYIMRNFGFGDFVFRLPDGTEIARAGDFLALEKCLETVDERSIVYHANRNHFSNWIMARTEFGLAAKIRPRKVSEFKDPEELRRYLVDALRDFRREKQRGAVTDFSRKNFSLENDFVRIGSGSLGGKGRGLAFINSLLNRYNVGDSFPNARISVPPSAVIGSDVYDQFLRRNNLHEYALGHFTDDEIAAAFVQGALPPDIVRDLKAFLNVVDYPLAVRSSSLLEDSHYQPFAGIFDTHMLPNCHPVREERLERLEAAIKYIYASIFFKNARHYIEATGNRVEEEKMAVVIQMAAGRRRQNYFYPVVSGIARSYNYYSIGNIKPEEGISYIALGLGKTIVEGSDCLYFSPSNPQRLPQFSSARDFLKYSQKEFFAINMEDPSIMPRPGGDSGLVKLGVEQAEKDGTIAYVGSTYSSDDDRVYDGISRDGIRVVTFAPILKSRIFPLDDIIRFLLRLSHNAMNCPVEIEFAADIGPDKNSPNNFYFLQIRPMAKESDFSNVSIDDIDRRRIICRSVQSLGNGRISDIRDILYVNTENFDRAKMQDMASEVGRFNDAFKEAKKSYLLIGPGRWGTSDRWLGIPVSWSQISSARVIVEAAYGDFSVSPSFGTHFFQNLISSHIGYLTVEHPNAEAYIDWEWLAGQPVADQSEHIRHIVLDRPIEVLIDGRVGKAAILKPEIPLQRND
jgi:disulfide oxidoreductase YuzD